MARIDDLVKDVPSKELQAALGEELAELRKRVPFGLVYERHLPEFAVVADQEVLPASYATPRDDHGRRLRVLEVENGTAKVVENGADEPTAVPVEELLAVRGLSEKIFPGLTSVERLERASEKPWHAVIKGENYHALQLLEFTYRGQVDCIYIDPPYNTGARNWTYNNHYVDDSDAWRHSKWLSFMEKRLRIARRLLKANGVLIVTIDENEVHHLGVLLEEVFPNVARQLVTICINPSGASGGTGLSRVEEYAFFCFLGDAEPVPTEDDMLIDLEGGASETAKHGVSWERLLRRGSAWYRSSRPNLCYPVLLNKDKTRIIGAGEPYTGAESKRPKTLKGHPVAWPVRSDGRLGIWRVEAARLNSLTERGFAYVSSPPGKDAPTLRYLLGGTVDAIEAGILAVTGKGDRGEVQVEAAVEGPRRAKTVWNRGRHIAGGGAGTQLLTELLGQRSAFTYPKSLYAVRDCLEVAIGDRDDALIMDFFAGSGTTLHATALLNQARGGTRRCVLVTNNEVDGDTAAKLHAAGRYAGDADFEARGVFEAVTRPRCMAALTGERPDGKPVKGKYLDGRPYADGFQENCEFFQLDYLDPTAAELGYEFERLLPVFWLMAGGVGPIHGSAYVPFSIMQDSPYALFSHSGHLREFRERLEGHGAVEHLFLLTDSEDAYAEWCQRLGAAGSQTHMVPLDYMTFFRRYRASRG